MHDTRPDIRCECECHDMPERTVPHLCCDHTHEPRVSIREALQLMADRVNDEAELTAGVDSGT